MDTRSPWYHLVSPIMKMMNDMVDSSDIEISIVEALEQAYRDGRNNGERQERRFPRSNDKTGS